MALITSDFDAMRFHGHQMALITSDCVSVRAAQQTVGGEARTGPSYFVDASKGSDSAAGTSAATAFKTL